MWLINNNNVIKSHRQKKIACEFHNENEYEMAKTVCTYN